MTININDILSVTKGCYIDTKAPNRVEDNKLYLYIRKIKALDELGEIKELVIPIK